MRFRELPGTLGHREQLSAARTQLFQLVGEPLRRQCTIRDQKRGAFAHKVLRVVSLMIVHGGGERHQDRTDSDGGKLGHGERTGAADYEIRPSVRLGHVLDEGAYVSAHTGTGITLASCLNPTLACLMTHIEGH
jgi:hypothetical protein